MMEKELTAIEDEHVLMRERVVQCKRAQVAMAQNVVEVDLSFSLFFALSVCVCLCMCECLSLSLSILM